MPKIHQFVASPRFLAMGDSGEFEEDMSEDNLNDDFEQDSNEDELPEEDLEFEEEEEEEF
jgi:hypothetical protein